MAGRIPRQSVVLALVFALAAFPAEAPITPDMRTVMNHISADSLRGNLSFIASDLLEGRSTPSRGLDLAAEYIAAQFRRVGLEPAGDDGYFQTATLADFGSQGRALARELGEPRGSMKMRNVAGILRGSDPVLRNSYVMLTAHYDHIGVASAGADRVFNGANDNGSGTVSVIEIASALAALPVHPKRSFLFVTFFGEEWDPILPPATFGLMGSLFYTQHPLVPPEKTIADLNLEMLGRSDATNGPQIKTASITGFDFSDLPQIIAEAGQLAGVKVYKDNQGSDPYFSRSDNQPLADLGIPSHTLCVAFDFSDYHKVTDHWDKIDYPNMAAVDRAVALGLMHLASDAPPPKWNESYAPARRYVDAGKRLHP